MKSSGEYAHGLDNIYDGLQIHIRQGVVRNADKKTKADPERLHQISGYLKDE